MKQITKLIFSALLIQVLVLNNAQAKKVNIEEKLLGSWSIYGSRDDNSHTINIKEVQEQKIENYKKSIYKIVFDDNFSGTPDSIIENLQGYFIDGNLYLGIIPNTPFVSQKYFYVFNMSSKKNFGAGVLTFYGSVRCEATTDDPSLFSCDDESNSESYVNDSSQKIIKDGARITPDKIGYSNIAKQPAEFISSKKIKGIWELQCRETTTENGNSITGNYTKDAYITIYDTSFKASGQKVFQFKYYPINDTELAYDFLRGSFDKNRIYLNVPSLEGIKQYFFRLNKTAEIFSDFSETKYPPGTLGYGYENINDSLGNCARQDDNSILCEDLNTIETSSRSCRLVTYSGLE
jgi:hypothetical protein